MKVKVSVCAFVLAFAGCFLFFAGQAKAQGTDAAVSGQITDPDGRVVPGVTVVLTNLNTNVPYTTQTNNEGIYRFAAVQPGIYRANVTKEGFASIVKGDIELHVQGQVSINFALKVGSVSETMTIVAGAPMINTTDASVSTVVDQSYVRNMPLNGRSFQDLILLTPGIVTQTSQSSLNSNAGNGMTGEFSVNGQRPESNNYTVDGVSANLGAAGGTVMITGAGASGSVPGATALGTTQALVSVDDLQEFRLQSSTYSAEYGRNPGGQFAFETKSGTNQWHGTASEYLRNNVFDANDWFNNALGVPEPPLKQNDFGGTFGGPVRIPHLFEGKDKTFFFLSYEGLRLLQPQAASVNDVPDDCVRGTNTASCAALGENPADPAVQGVLRAFPVGNGAPFGDGMAPFKASWSNPSAIDSTSVRFDHVVSNKLRLFFRFSDTGSNTSSRGTFVVGTTPSMEDTKTFTMRTYTAGANSMFTNRWSNDFRVNYSSNEIIGNSVINAFGRSTPVNLAQLTGLPSTSSPQVSLCFDPLCPTLGQGPSSGSQKQWNLVDMLNYALGRHQLKFGVDYRRLAPFEADLNPNVLYFYFSESSLGTPSQPNSLDFAESFTQAPAYPLYKNFSAFAEDEWKVSARLNLSMGLRWDLNPPPGVTQGLKPYTVTGASPDTWNLAPQGTPLWHTAWFNFAPRLGAAYSLRNAPGRETVLRMGGGVFFDTAQQLGSAGFIGPGFIGQGIVEPDPTTNPVFSFPSVPAIPAVTTDPALSLPPTVFPTRFQSPYTLQWNASMEQALGSSQSLTISYVGAHASRLLRQDLLNTPNNPNGWSNFFYVNNGNTSDYHSGQLQYRRRLSQGLTALASYTWSHCIDYGSQNYYFGYQRGNCDYDVRHNFSSAFSYDLPNVGHKGFVDALLHNWGLDNRLTARSGFPITLDGSQYVDPLTAKTLHSGLNWDSTQPLYLYGASFPGGRAVSPGAFSLAVDSNNKPVQGNAPRNFVRGFGAWQMDIAVRREFPIYEQLKLQFRAEAFNIFNHPNFGTIDPAFGSSTFGQARATLANSLGILSPLYQMGGPRSLQLALKLVF